MLLLIFAVPICALHPQEFEVDFQWSYINFTWPNANIYRDAINSKSYIPENNVISGIKFYKDKMYTALPRVRPGSPVVLAYVSTEDKLRLNPLLTPYPSWEMNAQPNCATLQNIHSFEIDRKGIMWVLDGVRWGLTTCPCKLVLVDLNDAGKVIHTYTFKDEICLNQGGYLNDLVIDERDGGYAYITDTSLIDPGLIVFSKQQNTAWKLRDATMFAELTSANLTVNGTTIQRLISIDGIALQPIWENENEERLVYYSPLIGKRMFSISTNILRNESLCKTSIWRSKVKLVGTKRDCSDGLLIDNQGNMYLGLLKSQTVAKWNINERFETKKIGLQGNLIMGAAFGMDSKGYLYLLDNAMPKFLYGTLEFSNDINIKTFKMFTGTRDYMFSAG